MRVARPDLMQRHLWLLWIGEAMLLAALALLTVNRFAPDQISGDVMLYSVMSLQNVTVFFWEQNRLLNVGPALTSVIREPALNFYLNLLLPALAFYGLLRAAAGQAVRLASPSVQGGNWHARILFVGLAAAILLVFHPAAIYDMVIWHIEYPLSCLLLLWSCRVWFESRSGGWQQWVLAILLLGLALGVNFSIVIVALATVGARAIVKRNLDIRGIVFGSISLVLFLLWLAVAQRFPGPSAVTYSGFALGTLRTGLPQVVMNFASMVRLPVLILLGFLILAAHVALAWRRRIGGNAALSRLRWLLGLFGVGWLLLFSGNAWVAANQFHYRYFAFTAFAFGMLLLIELAGMLVLVGKPMRKAGFALAVLLLAAGLAREFVPLDEYAFSQRLAPAVEAGATVYAGEFSLAWASVMLGLLRGQQAFGVAERAAGNARAARRHAADLLERTGVLPVACVQAAVDRCAAQANALAGPLHLRSASLASAPGQVEVWRLELQRPAPEE